MEPRRGSRSSTAPARHCAACSSSRERRCLRLNGRRSLEHALTAQRAIVEQEHLVDAGSAIEHVVVRPGDLTTRSCRHAQRRRRPSRCCAVESRKKSPSLVSNRNRSFGFFSRAAFARRASSDASAESNAGLKRSHAAEMLRVARGRPGANARPPETHPVDARRRRCANGRCLAGDTRGRSSSTRNFAKGISCAERACRPPRCPGCRGRRRRARGRVRVVSDLVDLLEARLVRRASRGRLWPGAERVVARSPSASRSRRPNRRAPRAGPLNASPRPCMAISTGKRGRPRAAPAELTTTSMRPTRSTRRPT